MRTFEQYETEIVESVKKHNIFTQNMIFTFYTGISRAHFFEKKLNESDHIKKAIDDNKNRTKQSMLNKWYKSDNPTLQMGLMKLIGSEDEADRLNGSRIKNDITSKGESLKQAQADLSGLTTEELKAYQTIQSKIENK